ncbi:MULTISPECIES: RNA-binding S4 domain-containing protein [unclassified Beijerinckia]|uniref:RNA-binding S4 domain-containing protein n=1 Tax=unclassified Beijerinckia TaxID=2638183 RepID=UPI0008989C36|nr:MULTISPECIES: RNA-binding S4 domain-containing protein [unclassified Beijerinckia]MDH7798148.1 ribosome-associated heat shock protein Hsp15 [Beijerinckia sp. GAS462]SED10738.1 heat shock protein Hsp15 [Beijerinckia sp. 28-YEA-48]
MTIAGRQRLDKWLWFARVVKSRTLAAKLVMDGFVRVNSVKADAPAKPVGPGDVLTIALERQVRILKVLAPGVRRGPYEEARTLYEDCSPPPAARDETPEFGERERGTGRPTKKERRSHDAIFGSGKVD